jgi:hypothetical protein
MINWGYLNFIRNALNILQQNTSTYQLGNSITRACMETMPEMMKEKKEYI